MQVRYADTPSQKELKRVTAERRQFRTNEYNIGAYGTADVGIHPSIYAPQPAWRSAARVSDRYDCLSQICFALLTTANIDAFTARTPLVALSRTK